MTNQGWGKNLRKWRLQRGYTLAKLAVTSGLSERLLWQLEQGIRKGTPNQWLKIAQALGVEMRELMNESETKPDDPGRIEETAAPYLFVVVNSTEKTYRPKMPIAKYNESSSAWALARRILEETPMVPQSECPSRVCTITRTTASVPLEPSKTRTL